MSGSRTRPPSPLVAEVRETKPFDQNEARGVKGRHTEQQPFERSDAGERRACPDRCTCGRQREAAADEHQDEVPAAGAERDANAELAPAAGDGLRQHTENPHRGQQQRNPCERAHHGQHQLLRGERLGVDVGAGRCRVFQTTLSSFGCRGS